jgi:uncharacterized protein
MDKKTLLQQRRPEILSLAARYDVRRIRVFGSVARNQAGAASDIDFLVEVGPEVSALDLGGFLVELEQLLGCEVDIVTEKGLRPRIRQRVLDEAVPL